MRQFKKYAAPLAVFGMLTAGAAGLTFVNQTQAAGLAGKGRIISRAVTGTVTGVSGSNITLTGKNSVTYTVDATNAKINKIVNGTKTTISASQIGTGDNLMVMGTVNGTNVVAKTILDGTVPAKQAQGTSTTGIVSAVSGNTITLTNGGTTYTVDATNASLMVTKPAGTSLLNSGIVTGDSVNVIGTVNGTNIVASKIMDGKPFMGKGFGMMGK